LATDIPEHLVREDENNRRMKKRNIGCFALYQTTWSVTSAISQGEMEQRSLIKPIQLRGMALTIFSFTSPILHITESNQREVCQQTGLSKWTCEFQPDQFKQSK